MRLFIAEKPSLGRAIADVLPKPHRKGDGYIECGNGQVVTWCIGHLLEQAQPDIYDSRYARWNLNDLPIVPEKWQLQPKPSVTKQLNVIKRLLGDAEEVIHAGDPDREGQLLVDEVLDYLQLAPEKRQQVQRCLINDLNPQAVERAINRLRANSEFVPLCVSALARARADWLYGINMTRAYTLLGRNAGYQGVLSVGRVQTPVLGLVVRRDEEIENFVAKDFFDVKAHIVTPQEERFVATWVPSGLRSTAGCVSTITIPNMTAPPPAAAADAGLSPARPDSRPAARSPLSIPLNPAIWLTGKPGRCTA